MTTQNGGKFAFKVARYCAGFHSGFYEEAKETLHRAIPVFANARIKEGGEAPLLVFTDETHDAEVHHDHFAIAGEEHVSRMRIRVKDPFVIKHRVQDGL